MLKEFMAQIEPKLLGQLVEVVFDKMKTGGRGGVAENGEEIHSAVAEAKRQFSILENCRFNRHCLTNLLIRA